MRWQERFVNDELWLRSRRVLLAGLREVGLDSPYEAHRQFLSEQHAIGSALLTRLPEWIGSACAAELGHETFLGARRSRFSRRLPFILAFMAEYGRWLALLAPPATAHEHEVSDLAALFNLGIVLVDQIADDPARRDDIRQLFGTGRLERLMVDPAASRELRDRAGVFATPELRVLAAIVAAFFGGVARIAGENSVPELRDTFADAIGRACAAQIAVASGVREATTLRAKSVTPFVIPPVLTLLAADMAAASSLIELGEHVGEIFWRVDDLVDAVRDFVGGDGNVLLLRSHAGGNGNGLASVLEGVAIEAIAREAAAHARAALALLDGAGDGMVRRRAARWLEMYIVDWMR